MPVTGVLARNRARRLHERTYNKYISNVENIQACCATGKMADVRRPHELLTELRERSGHGFRDLAKLLGYKTPSGLQTLEKPDRGDKPYSLQIVRRLAPHLIGRGSPPITLVEIARLLGGRSMPFATAQEQASVYDLLDVPLPAAIKERVSVIPPPTHLMPLAGSAQASFWMTTTPSIDAPIARLAIPFVPDVPAAEQYALKVAGPSMNKLVGEGAYVICVRFGGTNRKISHDAVVHVERNRLGETEWTLKRVKYDQDGAHLWPESDHPDFQSPLPYREGDGAECVRVLGIAIGSFVKFA